MLPSIGDNGVPGTEHHKATTQYLDWLHWAGPQRTDAEWHTGREAFQAYFKQCRYDISEVGMTRTDFSGKKQWHQWLIWVVSSHVCEASFMENAPHQFLRSVQFLHQGHAAWASALLRFGRIGE